METLDLCLTDSARAHIAKLMQGQEAGALPAIMFGAGQTYNPAGVLTRQDPPHWQLNIYTKPQIEQFSTAYAERGHSLVYEAEGVILCIPQPQLAAELAGKTLDVVNRRVCVS